MRLFVFILIAFMISAPAYAQTDDTEVCSVKVVFGSFARGIDIHAYEEVRNYLDESSEVDTYTDTSWGREGERTLCITAFSLQAADEIYEDIIDIAPTESNQAWTEVMHEDGRTQKTQWDTRSPKNP